MVEFTDVWNIIKDHYSKDKIDLIIEGILRKIQNKASSLAQAFKWCAAYQELKRMIEAGATIPQLLQRCQEFAGNEGWIQEFSERLKKIAGSTGKVALNEICLILTDCYDKAFFDQFSLPLIANAIRSLFESYKLYSLINGLNIIPERKIKRIKTRLEKCARTCAEMVDKQVLEHEDMEKLQQAHEKLDDIKGDIEDIMDDLKNKMAEAERCRFKSIISSIINIFNTIVKGIHLYNIRNTAGPKSFSGVTTTISTVTLMGCTITNLINARKANALIGQLQSGINTIEQLSAEQERFYKLSERLLSRDRQA